MFCPECGEVIAPGPLDLRVTVPGVRSISPQAWWRVCGARSGGCFAAQDRSMVEREWPLQVM